MNQLKEIAGFNKRGKQIMQYFNLPASFPLDDLFEITLIDHNGKPYIYRILKNVADNADPLGDPIVESISIDLDDIKELFIRLTDDQRNIVMHVYYLYKNKQKNCSKNEFGETYEDNPKIILQGPAGSGKSTIINFIEQLITWEENKISDSPQNLKVLKCAFTGNAASNIDGLTLNHVFAIPIYKTRNLSKKRLESKKELLKDCIFFICDEISMVGEKIMSTVNSRLQQIFDNEKLYGGRFVLLVGDLYQIDPVRQQPVYPNSKYWTCCEYYELTEIIRQQDDKFINALNNFRDSQMTEENIDLLRSRIITDIVQVPDSVIHLFYLNKHVDEYNTVIINKSNEKEEIVNAFEESDDWLPSRLRVKIGIRYMITNNIDVGDGLANGTTGIVKEFDYDEHQHVRVIWMEFHSTKIGKKMRSEYLNKHEVPSGFNNWVPIPRSKIIAKFKSNPKITRTIGNMFPLRAAEAVTIHKSQGQTYHDGVCVHFTSDSYDKLNTDKSLQYVALTRVRRLEDLYISGDFKFSDRNSNKFTRKENELNRLRNEKKLKLAFDTFEGKTGDVIVYLNTGSTFNEHYDFITADKWYKNASLLIFSQTNTTKSDYIKIPNFEMVYRTDEETDLRSGEGIICYKEPNKSTKVVCWMRDSENKIRLTLSLYEKYLYIISGVKGDMSDNDFKSAIKTLLSECIQNRKLILFIGDVNINPNITPSIIDFLKDCKFKKELSCEILTSNGESQCDMVFTRNFPIQQDNVGFYEYIPSSHKPIYVKLPPELDMTSGHGEVCPGDYKKAGNSKQFKLQEAMETDTRTE